MGSIAESRDDIAEGHDRSKPELYNGAPVEQTKHHREGELASEDGTAPPTSAKSVFSEEATERNDVRCGVLDDLEGLGTVGNHITGRHSLKFTSFGRDGAQKKCLDSAGKPPGHRKAEDNHPNHSGGTLNGDFGIRVRHTKDEEGGGEDGQVDGVEESQPR
jgi:hypothetical protein